MPRKIKKPAEKIKSAKKSKLAKRKRISEKTEKVSIKKGINKKSPHLINLKNPNHGSIEEKRIVPSLFPAKTGRCPNRILKAAPKKIKKTGVNFISKTAKETSKLSISKKTDKNSKIAAKENIPAETEEEIEDIFAPSENFNFWQFCIPKNWPKKIAVFVAITLILILPLQAFTYYQDLQNTKDRILFITNEAIDNLKTGQQLITKFDLEAANWQFAEAENNFSLAKKEINELNFLTTEILKLLPGQTKSVKTGMTLLEVGEIVSETGQILIANGQKFLTGGGIHDYYQSLVELESSLKLAIDKFAEAKAKIKTISLNDLPPEHQQDFIKIMDYLPIVEKGLIDLHLLNKSLLTIIGHEQWQRYLLIFLNNNELRGGGGFMGSFALMDVDRGQIKGMEVPAGGTYDLRAALKSKVISPDPLHLINPHWEFQDANWWPDYPTTAKKIKWFYENAQGMSIDGVISLTSTFMEELIGIFGPIPMPDYGREITNQNFVAETQKIVQLEYDKEENRPKQFIADLTPKLMQRVFSADKEQLQKLIVLLQKNLKEKQLLAYFSNSQLEQLITDFGWNAELKQTDGDYLAVIHTNLAGGKTDGVIEETIQHQAEIQADGSIINTVKLIRRHNGPADGNIFTGVQNNSYARFYVPAGSTLIEASGFEKPNDEFFKKPDSEYQPDLDLISVETEKAKDGKTGTDIYKESGKTVFGNWLQLKPGEIQEVIIKYRLPFNLSLEGQDTYYYSFLAQKQAGSRFSEIKSNLKISDDFKLLAKFPPDILDDGQNVSFSAKLITDKFYGVVLVNK